MSKTSIGTRASCGLCGQDIEWNGDVWWDRGGNTTCVPYEKDGGIVIPSPNSKHYPYEVPND